MINLAFLSRNTVILNIPSEFSSVTGLMQYLGVSAAELRKIWWYRGEMYKKFDIAKSNGRTRLISAPNHRLKMLQRKIASSLDKIYRPRQTVHGFVSGRSIKSNATAHLRSKFLMNLDIKGFFPAISEKRVLGLLVALGIEKKVSRMIARICCNEGALPQGSPSSPIISNMICFRLDKDLLTIAKNARCIYTRYADDVSFSSYKPLSSLFEGALPSPGVFSLDLLNVRLQAAFRNNGFAINPKKAHYADRHSRRAVTGLKINELVNVDRRFVRNIRAALYKVKTQGIPVAQKELVEKYGKHSKIGDHLQGRIAWVGHVKGRSDPVFRILASRYNELFPNQKLEILPTADEIRDRAVWVVEHMNEQGEGSQGTAFFMKSVGLLTAWHCVESTSKIELYHPSKPSNRFEVTVSDFDKHRDLAILNHKIPKTEFYELESSIKELKLSDRLMAVGYPGFGPGDKINVRPGQISSLPIKRAVPIIEVTQNLAQGMSGGPIIDDRDRVVGIIHKGGSAEDRDFAVRITALFEWIEESRATV